MGTVLTRRDRFFLQYFGKFAKRGLHVVARFPIRLFVRVQFLSKNVSAIRVTLQGFENPLQDGPAVFQAMNWSFREVRHQRGLTTTQKSSARCSVRLSMSQ